MGSESTVGSVAPTDEQPVQTADGSDRETVLKTVWVTDGRPGSSLSMHLTNKRLVVEPRTPVDLVNLGGLVGAEIAQRRAEKRAEEEDRQQPPVDAKKLDDILCSERRAYAINYADIATVVLSKKWPAHGISKYGRCKIKSAGRKATLLFHREMFDEVSPILTGLLPGRITVK